jgi:hypothetical protein
MRLTLTLAASASGRLCGVSGNPTRAGARLSARVPRIQPRSASQSAARHLTGSLPAVWRSLTAAQLLSWYGAAPRPLSGYNLFLQCNRRLLTAGLPLVLQLPSSPSAIPPIRSLLVLPQYNQPSPPQLLTSLPVFLDLTLPSPFYAILRATFGHSPAKGHTRASDFRFLAALPLGSGNTLDLYGPWVSVWGYPILSGVVTVSASLLDPRSGFAGPALTASAAYATIGLPVSTPSTLTILQNDSTIAVLPNASVTFGG